MFINSITHLILTDKWLNTVNLQFYLFKSIPCFVSCRFQPGKKNIEIKRRKSYWLNLRHVRLIQIICGQYHSIRISPTALYVVYMWKWACLLETWHMDQIYYPTCQFHHSRTPPLPLHQIRKQYLIRYPCKVGTFAFCRCTVLQWQWQWHCSILIILFITSHKKNGCAQCRLPCLLMFLKGRGIFFLCIC
jgi:hypothetical protein